MVEIENILVRKVFRLDLIQTSSIRKANGLVAPTVGFWAIILRRFLSHWPGNLCQSRSRIPGPDKRTSPEVAYRTESLLTWKDNTPQWLNELSRQCQWYLEISLLPGLCGLLAMSQAGPWDLWEANGHVHRARTGLHSGAWPLHPESKECSFQLSLSSYFIIWQYLSSSCRHQGIYKPDFI